MSDPSLIGRQLGAYRVVSLLGKGGMGEVYYAHDTKLGRGVAIKVLPAAYASDPDRLNRFRREARLLAALNHPHIASIYGFEELPAGSGAPGELVSALVLELVEGPTLAERLAGGDHGGPFPIEEALRVAGQICEALEAAHARGIVHRDLKPANVKAAPGGPVKVLDFGLAKVWAADVAENELSQVPTVTSLGSREGLLVGTAPYMSPEQARGAALDKRTDVWAFGCVLFEMLSGRVAFAGETVSDTIARILEREPDWSLLPAATPARVRDLLRRCLQKDCDRRVPDLAEARGVVEATRALPFKAPRRVLDALRWKLSRPLARAALLLLALVGVAAFVALRLPRASAPALRLANPKQVTSTVGVEDHPTWSPDRRTLAYESNQGGGWDVWSVPLAGGPAVNLTRDHAGSDRYPSWSPDGRGIAFWSDRDGGGYFAMPALGGEPTKLIATPGTGQHYHSAPEWSADGAELAGVTYAVAESRFRQFAEIVSLASGEHRRIALPGTEETRLDLAWSRDGRLLAYVEAGQQQSEVSRLRVLRLADGASAEITDGRTNARRPRWSEDGRSLVYVCNCAGPADLWRQAIAADGSPAGERERITSGLEVRDAAFSLDGSRLSYSKGRWVSNYWRVPILEDRPATWADAEQVTFDQAYVEFLDVSPDGRQVAYSSDRAGNQDLWLMPLGGEPVQLTTDPAPDWAPAFSPDGKWLSFYSNRSGDREIWKIPVTGGEATRLTFSPGLDAGSHWSPDGRELAIRSERTGDSEVWVIGADGSGARQVTHDPASDGLPAWSPDGRWLAFTSTRSGTLQIWRDSPQGGTPELLSKGPGIGPRWLGDQVYFNGAHEREGNLWRVSVVDRRERPMTSLVGRRGTLGIMQPATDGRYLYFSWRDDLGDIWVMDALPR
ncbi:MAG TPA: protein kinase [Vicinamibacteria bacterium]